MLKLVKDLMMKLLFYQPNRALKARRLLATQLTPIQKAEKMMKEVDLMTEGLHNCCPP